MEAVGSKIPAKWRRVGVSLGISMEVLNGFDQQRHGDPIACFEDVFTYWHAQQQPTLKSLNWKTIVTVLRSNYVGENNLSCTIEKEFL